MTGPARSTTRRTLHLLQVLLLLATVAALAGPVAAATRVHSTAHTVRTQLSQCLQLLAAEEEDLLTAERAAVDSFATRQDQLSGPGVDYDNTISRASRRLAQVAELNVAGDLASQHLQVLQGMLVTYQSLVSQARAYGRDGGDRTLATAYLRYAANLLHSEILAQLHDLQNDQRRALEHTIRSGAVDRWTTLLWSVPVVTLLVLLVVTQVFLARRFRRTLDLLMVTATVLAVGLAALAWSTRSAEHHLVRAGQTLTDYTDRARADATAIGLPGQRRLNALVTEVCPTCGVTEVGAATDTVTRESVDRELGRRARRADDHARAAESTPVWPLVALPALIALLTVAGLRARIEEYRYRAR